MFKSLRNIPEVDIINKFRELESDAERLKK